MFEAKSPRAPKERVGDAVERVDADKFDGKVDGFLNIDKPVDVTSRTIDRVVRRLFDVRRVGHVGTLDPFACGVLPIALGRATKFIDFLPTDKSYRATLLFGRATDSGDRTGTLISQLDDFSMPTAAQLDNALRNFVGSIEQIPPKFSAVKLNGRKAYELARRAVEFDIPPRIVTIDRIELVSIHNNVVVLNIDCQKGTYIRSLASDIGRVVGLPVMLTELRRTRSGGFDIAQAISVDELRAESVIAVDDCLKHLPIFELSKDRRKAFINGLPTSLKSPSTLSDSPVRVYCANEFFYLEFLGLGSIEKSELKAVKLFVTD